MAISLTKVQAAYRAWVMAAQGLSEEESGIHFSDSEELVDEAVKVMCESVFASNEWKRLQTTYSISLAGDGSGILNDADFTESVKSEYGGEVVSGVFAYPLIYMPNFRDLLIPKAGGNNFGYFTLRGGNSSGGLIYCANGDGTPLTGSVTIKACQYQTFNTLSAQLEDEFLITLAELLRKKKAG